MMCTGLFPFEPADERQRRAVRELELIMRGRRFRALRARIVTAPEPGYFSTDRRGLIPVHVIIHDHRMRVLAFRDRIDIDFFAMN